MALIVCEECGRKVSDTVSVCVHCGAPIQKVVVQQEEEKVQTVAEITVTEPETEITEPKFDYDKLNKDIRMSYELQFLETCAWAKKYRQTLFDIQKLKSCFNFGIIFFWPFFMIMALVMVYMITKFGEIPQENSIATTFCFTCLIFMFVTSLILRILMPILEHINNHSWKKYAYLKKYQQWLAEEKNIQYTPIFTTTKAKEKFDNVDLNNLCL